MISVLTPTVRADGLPLVEKALQRQSTKEFEWIIGSPFKPLIGTPHIHVEDTYTDGVWSLNRIYNRMIEAASGDLLVTWQDFTFADPYTLEKFLFHHTKTPERLVTAVGDKYSSVYPERGEVVWKDPRKRSDIGSFYRCYPVDIEWNLASAPKQALYDIGGFDESLDFAGFGMDGYGVNMRLEIFGGYDFWLDQSIESFSDTHGRLDGWDENNLVAEFEPHMARYRENPVLDYLINPR